MENDAEVRKLLSILGGDDTVVDLKAECLRVLLKTESGRKALGFLEKDPWAHRSSGMRCGTCMWFVGKKREGDGWEKVGRCRKHAPTLTGYPCVFGADWCGDHKLNENKI